MNITNITSPSTNITSPANDNASYVINMALTGAFSAIAFLCVAYAICASYRQIKKSKIANNDSLHQESPTAPDHQLKLTSAQQDSNKQQIYSLTAVT